jgi:hypothetical protein
MDLDIAKMSTLGLRECDRLDAVFNFNHWKLRLHILKEEGKVEDHVEKDIARWRISQIYSFVILLRITSSLTLTRQLCLVLYGMSIVGH